MQRRHFEDIARAFAKAGADIDHEELDADSAKEVLEELANSIADVCAGANPLFKRAMFLASCGL